MFLRKKLILLWRRWGSVFTGSLFVALSLHSNPAELPLNERNSFEDRKATMADQTLVFEAKILPFQMSRLTDDRFPVRHNSILKQRLSVQMSNEFRDRKMDSVVHRFSVMLDDDMADSNSPSSLIHSEFLKNVAFGTSGWVERKGMWKAHLQRTDFELLADKLSLNDINRFLFRKNPKNENDPPVKTAGGEQILQIQEK